MIGIQAQKYKLILSERHFHHRTDTLYGIKRLMCDQGYGTFEVCCVSETLCSFLYKKEQRMHENGPQISIIFEKVPKGAGPYS